MKEYRCELCKKSFKRYQSSILGNKYTFCSGRCRSLFYAPLYALYHVPPSRLGKQWSKESKAKASKSHKGKVLSEVHKRAISKSIQKYWSVPENRKKFSERIEELKPWLKRASMKGKALSPMHKKNMSISIKKLWKNGEYRKNVTTSMSGRWQRMSSEKREKTGNKISTAMKALWNNPEYAKKQLTAIFSNNYKPTKLELLFISFIGKYNLPFKYVGDGSFWIGKRNRVNPDFIHLHHKIAIELFGDYWHSPLLNPTIPKNSLFTEREKIFRENKWAVLILWESEITKQTDEELYNKLSTFVENKV